MSSPNVLLSSGQSNSIQAYPPEGLAVFNMYSGYFTSAYDSVLTVEALGFTPEDRFSPSFRKTFSINNAGPTLITFNWIGINEILLTGTYATPYSSNNYVLDNLLVDVGVPEPNLLLMTCVGLLAIYAGVKTSNARGQSR